MSEITGPGRYIYFSRRKKRDRDTDCYGKAIRFLAPDCEIDRTYSGIQNASDFNAFHDRFDGIINRVREENPDAEILLNISSATPQIKTAMCLEVVSHREALRPVQVSSPENKTNKNVGHFDPYKDDIQMEMGELYDNLPEAKKRCVEPDLAGIRKSMVKRQLKALIESWEYKGAYELAEKNAQLFTGRLVLLLRHACCRSLPDKKGAEDTARALAMYGELYPVQSADPKLTCEYYLAAGLRKKRGELTDFVLRVSALTEHLLRVEIGKTLGGWDRIARDGGGSVWKLDREKAGKNCPGLMEALDTEFPRGYDDRRGINLRTLESVAGFLSVKGYGLDYKGYEKLCAVRDGRNDSAHNLESVTESDLKAFGTNSEELLTLLRARIVNIYGKDINQKVFKIFESINDKICAEMDNNTRSSAPTASIAAGRRSPH